MNWYLSRNSKILNWDSQMAIWRRFVFWNSLKWGLVLPLTCAKPFSGKKNHSPIRYAFSFPPGSTTKKILEKTSWWWFLKCEHKSADARKQLELEKTLLRRNEDFKVVGFKRWFWISPPSSACCKKSPNIFTRLI